MSRVTNTEQFILKAKSTHGDKYDYSKAIYVNSQTKVTIICPEHAEFPQHPYSHIYGHGCPRCKADKHKERRLIGREVFIKRAKKVHTDGSILYDDVVYVNNRTKVKLYCKNHGHFYQIPDSHLRGTGCPKCGSERSALLRTMSYETFVAKARSIHGDRYNYDKVEITSARSNVTIGCKVHGDFVQNYDSHLCGRGCSKCKADKARGNTADFISRATAIHQGKYTYDKSVYTHSQDGIIVTCPKHGDFTQTARSHLKGSGCPSCKADITRAALSSNTEDFISKARAVHGDTYSYDKTHYTGSNKYLTITCKEHGDFSVLANSHLQGYTCRKCGNIKKGLGYRLSTDEFVQKASEVHGEGTYCYDESEYITAEEKVKIKCPKHGYFYQAAGAHLSGAGCPTCSSSKGESFIRRVLEKENIKYLEEYKLPGNRYRYDFYLPELNLLIEFHGIQHYRFIEIFHRTVANFEERKLTDRYKIELAKYNKIPLIVFNYKHLLLDKEVFESNLVKTLRHLKNRRNPSRWFYHEYSETFKPV